MALGRSPLYDYQVLILDKNSSVSIFSVLFFEILCYMYMSLFTAQAHTEDNGSSLLTKLDNFLFFHLNTHLNWVLEVLRFGLE